MIEIQIRTTKETDKIVKDMPQDFRMALVGAMNKVGPFLEAEVKKSFGRPGYPAVRTGHLRRSIYNKIEQRASNVIGIIGTEVVYGAFLEEGTRKMKARPFLRPAIEKNIEKISTYITDHVAKELNK